MKPFPGYVPDGEQHQQGMAAAVEVDLDGDNLEIQGDTVIDHKPSEDDFFNAFEDDFNDTDLACKIPIKRLEKCCEATEYKPKHCASVSNLLDMLEMLEKRTAKNPVAQ